MAKTSLKPTKNKDFSLNVWTKLGIIDSLADIIKGKLQN